MDKKIVAISVLEKICAEKKAQNKKIVLCHGYFDVLHIGHIRHFNQAKQMGDIVIATVICDENLVHSTEKPTFPENLRAEALASLADVDYVAIAYDKDLSTILDSLIPDIYAKGFDLNLSAGDEDPRIQEERRICELRNIELVLTQEISFSSTRTINSFFSSFPEHVQEYVHVFLSRYTLQDVLQLVDSMSGLKVAVIGDTILDDYSYCRTLGTSSKDPVMVVHYQSHDIFAGGILAVANHTSNFSKNVDLYTVLGDQNDYRLFIEKNLNHNVTPHFIIQEGSPTLVKRRFIDGYSLNKLFEVYIMDNSGLNEAQDEQFRKTLEKDLAKYDLVIVADFGHGAISKVTRKTIIDNAPFLALNTQANSGNRGFNTITQYDNAGYISIAEHELRLEMRDLDGDINSLANCVGAKMNADLFVVTRGKRGSLIRSKDGKKVSVPAFAHKIVDRIGSGDAFLSVTSLAAFLGSPPELLGFVGNIVGGPCRGNIGKPEIHYPRFIENVCKKTASINRL